MLMEMTFERSYVLTELCVTKSGGRLSVGARLLLMAITLVLLALPTTARSQKYPTKPIRLIAPFAPGGTVDIVSRIVARKLGEAWEQQVIVDNRAGAGGTIGTEIASRALPDGYTLVIGHVGTLAMSPSLYAKLPYDPVKDFDPIALVVRAPNGVVVHPSMPAQSIKELIGIARAKPSGILYASGGSGSSSHLATIYFALLAKIQLAHIPYKGFGPALLDLIVGRVSMMIPGIAPVIPYLNSGKLRILAVTSTNRLSTLPNVPTVIESGLPDYEATNWVGLLAPASTPPQIVHQLNITLRKALADRDLKERLIGLGLETADTTEQQFGDLIKAEIVRWRPVIKASGVRSE